MTIAQSATFKERRSVESFVFPMISTANNQILPCAKNIFCNRTIRNYRDGDEIVDRTSRIIALGNGFYMFDGESEDSDAKEIEFDVTADGARPVRVVANVGPPLIWDDIQQDIDRATPGDTIDLKPSTVYNQTSTTFSHGNKYLQISKPLILNGHDSTLIQTQINPNNHVLFVMSELGDNMQWEGSASGVTPVKDDVYLDIGQDPSTLFSEDETVMIFLGTSPQDPNEQHWVGFCRITEISGNTVRIDKPVEYNINQGGRNNVLYKIDSLAENVEIHNFNIDFSESHPNPGYSLAWIRCRNTSAHHIFGRATLALENYESETCNFENMRFQLEDRGSNFHGRLWGGWNTKNIEVSNIEITLDKVGSNVIFPELENTNAIFQNIYVNYHANSAPNRSWFQIPSDDSHNENVYFENIVMNIDTDFEIDMGSNSVEKSDVLFRDILSRSDSTHWRFNTFDRVKTSNKYNVLSPFKSVLPVTSSMVNSIMDWAHVSAIKYLWFYINDDTGLNSAEIRSDGLSWVDATAFFNAGTWTPFSDFRLDIHPVGAAVNYGLNHFDDPARYKKQLRLNTGSVNPNTYLIIAGEGWIREDDRPPSWYEEEIPDPT